MITIKEVYQIIGKLSLENSSISNNDLIDNLSCIIYRNDMFECGNTMINHKHIDMEFSFGEYYEIHETSPLFRFICTLCDFPLSEQEFMIYQKESKSH